MSWMKRFYGCEKPSPSRVSIISIIYIILALGYYGWLTDFIPSAEWAGIGFYASTTLAIIYYAAFYFLTKTPTSPIKVFKSKTGRVFQSCFIFIMFIAIFWFAIAHGAADLVTQVIGKPKTIEAELSKIHFVSKRSCDYRLEGYALRKAIPNHICISKEIFLKLPNQQIYQLQGKETFLGFHVTHIQPEQKR